MAEVKADWHGLMLYRSALCSHQTHITVYTAFTS